MIKKVIKSFSALSPEELYAIMQLRNEVFVVEQSCVFQDADGIDPKCLHIMMSENSVLKAYCRLVPPGTKFPEWSIGRVATSATVRGRGIGHALMQAAIEEIRLQGGSQIRISAQSYLEKFYQTHGFAGIGASYLEDDIPHVEMLRQAA